jgi:hypothetical protein
LIIIKRFLRLFNRNPKLKCLVIFRRLLTLLNVFNIWVLLHTVILPKLLPIIKRVSLLCSLLFYFSAFNAAERGFGWMWALIFLCTFFYTLERLVRVVAVVVHVDWGLQYELVDGDSPLTHTVCRRHFKLRCRRLGWDSTL